MSPRTEGWRQIGLNDLGQMQAVAGADFLQQYVRTHPRPQWGISSDLTRAEETLAITSAFLGGLPDVQPLRELRAFDSEVETPEHYEARSRQAFQRIFANARVTHSIPLIVGHRSTTMFLQRHHPVPKMNEADADYRTHSLLIEGGVMAITETGLVPLFRAIDENWKEMTHA